MYCINEDMATLSCVIIIMAGFMLSLTNAFSNAFEFEYCMGFRKIKSDFCVSKRTYIYVDGQMLLKQVFLLSDYAPTHGGTHFEHRWSKLKSSCDAVFNSLVLNIRDNQILLPPTT